MAQERCPKAADEIEHRYERIHVAAASLEQIVSERALVRDVKLEAPKQRG